MVQHVVWLAKLAVVGPLIKAQVERRQAEYDTQVEKLRRILSADHTEAIDALQRAPDQLARRRPSGVECDSVLEGSAGVSDIERTDTVDEIVGTAKLRVLANLPYGERKRVDDERSVLNILDAINLAAILAAGEAMKNNHDCKVGTPDQLDEPPWCDGCARIETWLAATEKLREETG